MALEEADFASIHEMVTAMIRRQVGTRGDYFITGKVIKVDLKNKCVYLKEFGDQAIPIISFDYEVDYYDQSVAGEVFGNPNSPIPYKTHKYTAVARVKLPKVGQNVLVAREMGTSRLPRCLGVIQGINWIEPGDD